VYATKLAAIFNPLCALTGSDGFIRQNAVVTLTQPIPSLLADQVFTAGRLWWRRLVAHIKPTRINVFRANPSKVA
jgi:hypothetical protein